jgi:putative transcriptional regulator
MSGRAKKSSARLVRKPSAPQSRILSAVHETAGDLLEAGFIDKRRMRAYDQLCLPPMRDYTADSIRALRDRYQVSQAVLAAILNTSLSTVRQWEIGEKKPSGPSVKLLSLLDRKGLQALL